MAYPTILRFHYSTLRLIFAKSVVSMMSGIWKDPNLLCTGLMETLVTLYRLFNTEVFYDNVWCGAFAF